MRKLTGKTIALIVVLVALAAGSWFMFGRTAAGIEYPNADKYTVGDAVIPGDVNNLFVDCAGGWTGIPSGSAMRKPVSGSPSTLTSS